MTSISTFQFGDGVSLVVERIEAVRSAAMVWRFPFGTAHDPISTPGAGAVLEELLLRGAGELKSRAQADAFDRIGASRNASMSTLGLSISSTMLGEHAVDALGLVADIARRPKLASDSFEPARSLALAELEALADDPEDRTRLQAKARHWPGGLGRSGYGTAQGLATLTHEGIADHWGRCARPKGCVIAVAGHVDPERIARAVESAVEGWEGAAPDHDESGAAPRGYQHTSDDTEQVQIVILHDAPLESQDEAPAFRVATQVLGGGMAARLFEEVREKRGLCYSVHASCASDTLRGWRTTAMGTTPAKAQESIDVLADELSRLHEPAGRITDEEFARAKAGLLSRIVFKGESTAARAASLASDIVRFGRPRSLAEHAERIRSVALDEVNVMLAQAQPGRATVQTLGPSPIRPPAWLLAE